MKNVDNIPLHDENNDCDTRAGGAVTNGFYAAEPDVTITLD